MQKIWRQSKYILPVFILPAIVLLSFYKLRYWSFFAGVFAFGLIPTLEYFLKGGTENLTIEEEKVVRKQFYYDLLIYLMVPVQYILLGIYLWRITTVPVTWYEFIGLTWAMSIACGVLGINIGHELGHRTKPFEQFLSKSLLLTSLYMHFYIEHNRGHHKNIATPLDPATSRLNEPIYKFFFRSVKDSWVSAWHLEAHRLKKINQNFWNPFQNQMLRFQIIQIALCALILAVFGWIGLLGFVLSAIGGFLLLESVNYIEHYGLLRKEISPGRYEKVKPHHSWNSNHELGRILLFELTRHSDHHYNSGRKYQILRHFDKAPQMPSGYPAMLILAMFPALWFKVMNPLVEIHNATVTDDYTKNLETVSDIE
ncbi:MAG: alkane 1-monooxygenase [Bacteroidota bacterium]|nr:alkane 1-monooxygenase [Bacteroidota bacterium]